MSTSLPIPVSRAPSVGALKRLDCLGFTSDFPAAERDRWEDWATRLWRADELAETRPLAFAALRATWEAERDFGPPGMQRLAGAWQRYLAALADYHRPGLVIRTIAEHDEMLLRLSGPLLQLAPGMPEDLWEAAKHFGAIDQFYNNLRDLHEDAERGLCWLPEEVLSEHGLTRSDVIYGLAPEMDGWRVAMAWWLGEHGRSLRRRAHRFAKPIAYPPIEAMRRWTLRRYARVERVLRAVDYDYRRFHARYWDDVRRELQGRGLLEGDGNTR